MAKTAARKAGSHRRSRQAATAVAPRGRTAGAGKDLLSIDNLSNADIQAILTRAAHFRDNGGRVARPRKITNIALFFDQGSTRSRLGFQAAAQCLGHAVIDGNDGTKSRFASGHESFADHIRVLAAYCDVIVTRTPSVETVHQIAALSHKPVINCGNGPDEHPTQALIDLFTIRSLFPKKRLRDITIAISGDPDSRHYKPFMKLMARIPAKAILFCHGGNARNIRLGKALAAIAPSVPFRAVARVEDTFRADVLSLCSSNIVKKVSATLPRKGGGRVAYDEAPAFRVTRAKVLKAKSPIKIIHPMPRENELDPDCDDLPNNAYFAQLELSHYLRMAILDLVLSGRRWGGQR